MLYRSLQGFDRPLSVMGMGTMRLPGRVAKGRDALDMKASVEMIRYGIDHGINYIDTARPYYKGDCEKALGYALKDGYREKTCLATKITPWQVNKEEDLEVIFHSQLENLQTDYIDVYLLHYLNKQNWNKFRQLHIFDFLERKREQGKLKHLGFSFHDDYFTFKEIIDYYRWDICQVQMNILDEENQATVKGIRYAGEKGIPVVIMEPLKGGRIVNNIPTSVQRIWDKKGKGRTPAEWAFKWLSEIPEAAVILNGVSCMEQLKQNIDIFNSIQTFSLEDEDRKMIAEVVEAYRKITKVECTGCRYCLPCHKSVEIPLIFQYYNEADMYTDYKQTLIEYWTNIIGRGIGVNQCVGCGLCRQKCPQGIDIPAVLKAAHSYLIKKAGL